MIAASVGKKQIGRTLLVIIMVIVLIFVAVYVVGKIRGKTEESEAIPGATAEQREEYLLSLGIQVDATSSVAEVGVPAEFDERFTVYNEMLKTTGFDLEPLKGETVKKCTYLATNQQQLGDSISVILLVYDGNIVAGHMLNNISNEIYPLFAVDGGETQQTEDGGNTEEGTEGEDVEDTILPAEAPAGDEADGGETGDEQTDSPAEEPIEAGSWPSD